MLQPGLKGRAERTVERQDTAAEVGSGLLLVFSTPSMVALMEQAACDAIAPELEEGTTSVGTKLEITHDSATPVGMDVYAEAELLSVEGRKLVFSVEAFDEKGLIGKGRHERVIVTAERFLNKTYEKL